MTPALASTTALGFLVVMVVSGTQPVQRQLVPFEAKGLLKTAPEQVRRIELSRGAERITVVRTGERGWATPEGTDVGDEAGKRLSTAVQMMHASGPANEISAAELAGADVAAFELDPPRLVARLYGGDQAPILTARFGAHNPDGFLQYMRVEGDPRVYLMSRFIGQEWAEALSRSVGR
ncbi:DUF4340 domain-containing protein [Vineibacter terrae]|uniref:DUF4340 domain-containing protein n=1 Tax=Vineibacter terrae TaxID=2586908 RepID=UPI002E35EE16|nr:DUF4340 domain-containing protein [Vineibacter terrae]HEX2892286.1 DUF4340 domain-containing protein [Vineibacter terrae]